MHVCGCVGVCAYMFAWYCNALYVRYVFSWIYRVKGNIVDIFDCIPLTEPSEAQYTRLISIIDDLIDSKVISTTPKYKSTATKLKEALPALQKKQKREHKKFHEEHGDTTFEDLVAKIKANQAKRAKKGIHNILDQKITTLKKQTKNKSSKS